MDIEWDSKQKSKREKDQVTEQREEESEWKQN